MPAGAGCCADSIENGTRMAATSAIRIGRMAGPFREDDAGGTRSAVGLVDWRRTGIESAARTKGSHVLMPGLPKRAVAQGESDEGSERGDRCHGLEQVERRAAVQVRDTAGRRRVAGVVRGAGSG